MTMSVGDLLDDWFETDELKGAIGSTGVVGVWAGPRTPGTAYNLLHHALGELDGVQGAWGHVKGGMGAISQALARSAEADGATCAPTPPFAVSTWRRAHHRRDARVGRDAAGSDRRVRRPPANDRPRAGGRGALPRRGGERHEALPQPRRLGEDQLHPLGAAGLLGGRRQLLRTGVAICPSLDYLERAWQDAVRGEPAAGPYLEVEVPSSVDPSLTDDGTCVMTMFTQYGPHREEDWARARARHTPSAASTSWRSTRRTCATR